MTMQEDGRLPVLFISRFDLGGYKCFKGKQQLNLSYSERKPANWTIILGNNGTGKTSLLEALELTLPIERKKINSTRNSESKENTDSVIVERLPGWFALPENYSWPELSFVDFSFIDGEMKTFNIRGWESDESSDEKLELGWSFSSEENFESLNQPINIYFSYWATRKMGKGIEVTETEYIPTHLRELINAEEWLAQLDYRILRGVKEAEDQWDTITKALVEILPDVKGFRRSPPDTTKNYIQVETDYGWVPLRQLSYGYQTMLAWIVDLAKRMIDAYPDSDTPLEESAVVLVDEIDLHLHPSWQRRIVGDLSRIFPNVQFIATSHSPLVVQSAERCNIAVLHKDGDRVHIQNIPNQSYQGWSVEEILRDLMEMDSTHSDAFTNALKDFELAIGADDYAAAQAAYQTLDQILHPESVHRKLMRMQMGGLERPAQV